MTAEKTTAWWKRGKKEPRTDREMSIAEHLQELRRRVIISLIALVIGTLIAFTWYTQSVGPIPTLGHILQQPYCKVPPEQRMAIDAGECRLLATGPFDMFMLRLKVSALVGLVLSSPVWLYQLWAFITPGLMNNERKWTLRFVGSAVALFVIGAVLAYIALFFGLSFLLTMGGDTQTAALTGERYFNFLLGMLLVFGISFEIPLLLVMLNQIGMVKYDSLKDKRRAVILVIFIFAAVVTPGQDPVGMTILGGTLCIMVELALQVCRLHDRRVEEERPEWMDLDDETASSLDFTPGAADAPEDIAAPESIHASNDLGQGGQAGSAVRPTPIQRPAPVQQSQDGTPPTSTQPVSPSNWDDIT